MSIRHAKTSGIANPADPTLVGGEDWDAVHLVSATDGQIVFMDDSDAVGSADLTWNALGPNILGLAADENSAASIAGIGVGVQLFFLAADGDASHVGGELTLHSGSSDGQSGGQLNIEAGSDGGGGDGGPLWLASGHAADGASGDIDIRVGGSGESATGGSINLWAGTGQTGNGGNVAIQAGSKVAGGSPGAVQMYSGDFSSSINLNAVGVFIVGVTINLSGLPTSDPLVAGQLFSNGAPSAGVPKALMVSGG